MQKYILYLSSNTAFCIITSLCTFYFWFLKKVAQMKLTGMQEKVFRCFFWFLWQPWGIFSCLIDWVCPSEVDCDFQLSLARQGGELGPQKELTAGLKKTPGV